MKRLTITVTARGEYYREELPEALATALKEEIASHMRAYGCQEVKVELDWAVRET